MPSSVCVNFRHYPIYISFGCFIPDLRYFLHTHMVSSTQVNSQGDTFQISKGHFICFLPKGNASLLYLMPNVLSAIFLNVFCFTHFFFLSYLIQGCKSDLCFSILIRSEYAHTYQFLKHNFLFFQWIFLSLSFKCFTQQSPLHFHM